MRAQFRFCILHVHVGYLFAEQLNLTAKISEVTGDKRLLNHATYIFAAFEENLKSAQTLKFPFLETS